MQKSVSGSICKYLVSYNAGLRKRPRSCPNEYASQLWHQLKKYFSIHHINGAFLMNVSRKHVKRSLKIEFCEGFDSCDRPSNLKLDSNHQFFRPSVCEIWWMTSKNNRALLLYYVKLCASFQIHWWIQTGFIVHKRSIRVEIGDILSRVTLKFDRWPWTTIGHLLYTTPSFVHHNKAIGKVKPELQSGNAQVRSKLAWPWNFMDDLERQ